MKYLPLSEIDTVHNALNFSTADLHVIGGCDIYTTKAAGSDKKLYKDIDSRLETQHQNLLRLSASFSPPDEKVITKRRSNTPQIPAPDLSRSSPFGSLEKPSARRTYAFMIATLNASHPDYDFSHQLRPHDFRKERSLRTLIAHVDSTLFNLRPRGGIGSSYLAPSAAALPVANGYGNEVWGPRMWNLMDFEMDLRSCERYSYHPQDDPFDGEEGAIWSMHYFFFNRDRKRVCYLYLRGLSVLGHSPVAQPVFVRQPKGISVGEGAGKRAQYWLGSSQQDSGAFDYEDDDDEARTQSVGRDVEMVVDGPGDDEIENPPYMDLDEVREQIEEGYYGYDEYGGEPYDAGEDFAGYEGWTSWDAGLRAVRGVSEEVGEMMEV